MRDSWLTTISLSLPLSLSLSLSVSLSLSLSLSFSLSLSLSPSQNNKDRLPPWPLFIGTDSPKSDGLKNNIGSLSAFCCLCFMFLNPSRSAPLHSALPRSAPALLNKTHRGYFKCPRGAPAIPSYRGRPSGAMPDKIPIHSPGMPTPVQGPIEDAHVWDTNSSLNYWCLINEHGD